MRRSTSTTSSSVGSASTAAQQLLADLGRHHHGHEAVLGAVVAEDVGEAGADHGLEAVVHDRPHGVLAARAGAEVGAADEDAGAGEALVVEHEAAVVAPRREQALAEAGALDPLEPLGRDDLVGVDVGAVERHRGALHDLDGVHQRTASKSVGRAKWPAMAVAAATAGETRWVRPPRPWRPSKLRLLVDADRSPGGELVGVHGQAHRAARLPPVEAGGGEHLVEALGLGLVLHRERAGHDERAHAVLHLAALGHRGGGPQVLDARVGAAADEHGVDGDVAHRRAGGEAHVLEGPGGAVALVRRRRSRRATGSAPASGTTWAGLVPQETCGAMSAASRCTSLSKAASSSVGSVRQSSSAASHAAPVGAWARPSR